jgi:DNA-binding LacI/PurR family transcriptional regulator
MMSIVSLVKGNNRFENVLTALEGIPSLVLDHYQAMRAVLTHLIEAHGCRRIAFVRGPAQHMGIEERYRAYTETLADYGLPFNPTLVTPPADFDVLGDMIPVLLDERNLCPGIDFDAIVGATDAPILRAAEVLQARGIKVPGEVAGDDHGASVWAPGGGVGGHAGCVAAGRDREWARGGRGGHRTPLLAGLYGSDPDRATDS